MKLRAVVVPLAVVFALAGCVPEAAHAPISSPSPSASVIIPSASPNPSATVSPLTLPEDCSVLVSLTTIHTQFSSGFVPIYLAADLGDDTIQSFASRNGLTCLWGIPNSDAGYVKVFAAVRATATDDLQIAAWRSAGYLECPPFLDACFYEDVTNEIGEVWTVHALVEGFELRVEATSVSLDPLLAVARDAATSMGYV
ncbi:MAG: hypothetical protein ABI238_07565 [Terrimesophilobacter sp.]